MSIGKNLFIKFISNEKNQFLINQIPEDMRQEIIESIKGLYDFLEKNNIISENKIEK